MTMYIIYRLRDCDGTTVYNKNSIIGIYNDYQLARYDLIEKLKKLKHQYEVEFDDEDYYFAHVLKNDKMMCYEIMEKKIEMNTIRMR